MPRSYVPFCSLLVALTFALLLAPFSGRAAETTIFMGESPAQMMDRLRSTAIEGNLQAAIDELADYVARHPDNLDAARLLGDFYYRKPDLVAAERIYKSIITRAPGDR
ncbi:MAG: tetratricopeptide repeat protein, partial [Candidatus Eremiobacteraeota bacterium]|nr:tetratricopeptide repeat protein [Candidatus Eremiobacteraeota bacterium]